MNKVYAISMENNFNIIKDKLFLQNNKIPFKDAELENIIIIANKYYYTFNGKWRLIGNNKWYGSKGIKDFINRFYRED